MERVGRAARAVWAMGCGLAVGAGCSTPYVVRYDGRVSAYRVEP
jgi:hypothetical protein